MGLAAAAYAFMHYNMGTITRMGPGMIPAALGVLMALFGVTISISGFFRSGRFPEVRTLTPIFILGSIAAFAVLVRPFGLIPAVFVATIVATFAELNFRPLLCVILGLALSLMAYVIFIVGLRLTIPPFAWPF
nr:tripartite tricarboxylate transporter TctB family protein [Pelagibacterium limicola]